MKILVCSDSHGNVEAMADQVRRQRPDAVFHLGDLLRDAEALHRECPGVPMAAVPGNCDGWTAEPDVKNLLIDGCRILMAHGHRWQVKSGYGAAIAAARRAGANVLLFGHTHQPCCFQEGGLWVMNPGAIGGRRGSCGLLTLSGGKISCRIVEAGEENIL